MKFLWFGSLVVTILMTCSHINITEIIQYMKTVTDDHT